jgi:hypothetical protein
MWANIYDDRFMPPRYSCLIISLSLQINVIELKTPIQIQAQTIMNEVDFTSAPKLVENPSFPATMQVIRAMIAVLIKEYHPLEFKKFRLNLPK